ncbi:hypothetical protein ANANG_G00146460 [Anguilla anguilla]|uniref:Nucleosome assembly protein 1-like 1 n=1 Tax=Anguilla anguilla TaxID=7936 RepID=A0A9D3MDS8_ANGAN|nr:hypothetical protein ANANG_G00146460 [Anguilla anguilla]
MRSEPDESDPFSFDGPEIMGCTGCQIDWTKGKNVTLKTIKKKQKHKGLPESGELDEDSEAILAADFEIGHFLRERIVPRAVLYFTGEAIEDDDAMILALRCPLLVTPENADAAEMYDEEGEEADDEEGEEEADEENDPEYDPKKDANPQLSVSSSEAWTLWP